MEVIEKRLYINLDYELRAKFELSIKIDRLISLLKSGDCLTSSNELSLNEKHNEAFIWWFQATECSKNCNDNEGRIGDSTIMSFLLDSANRNSQKKIVS